ncbi:MAG: hypothetical protein OXI30_20210 [Chloroflexota bacterium]|nr:hypothetical protein [Chloroflexota bacterium]
MELLCIGIIVLGILVAALPLIVVALKIIGGCLLLLAGAALIAGLAQSCSGNSSPSHSSRSDGQSVSIMRSTKTPRPRPTRTPRPSKTPLPTDTPTLLPDSSARLAFRLLPPENVYLAYDSASGGGTLHWDASRWMPTDPQDTNSVEYDILVFYPDTVSGPFITNDTFYTFAFLNAHSTSGIRIGVEAVGVIKIGPYEYYRRSGSTYTTWSPTPMPTVTPYPSENDIRVAVSSHADEVDILDIGISDGTARIEFKFISWLAVPNEDIAEEAAFKVICAVRAHHPEEIPYELQLVGQGWHEDEYGRNFTIPTVELHIPALAVNRINCESKPERVDWRLIASFYDS